MLSEGKTLLRQGDLGSLPDTPLFVNWLLTEKCNYNCSYCFTNRQGGVREHQSSLTQLQHAVDILASLNRSAYGFCFIGGEPTAHPELRRLMWYVGTTLKNRLFALNVTSNGSRSVDYYTGLMSDLAFPPAYYFSFHAEHADFDHFASLIAALSHKARVEVSLMFNPAKSAYTFELFERFRRLREEYPFYFSCSLLREPPRFDRIDSRYTDTDYRLRNEARQRFAEVEAQSGFTLRSWSTRQWPLSWEYSENGRKHVEHLEGSHGDNILEGAAHFQGMWCGMGTRVLAIYPNGICKGAECPSALQSHSSIYDENPFTDGTFPSLIRCREHNCGCSVNLAIPKFREEAEARNFVGNLLESMESPAYPVAPTGDPFECLDRMEAAIEPLFSVDPAKTCIAVKTAFLARAILHYERSPFTRHEKLAYVAVDWQGDHNTHIAAIEEKHNVCVLPVTQIRLLRKRPCIYARAPYPAPSDAEATATAKILQAEGIKDYAIDFSTFSRLLCHDPNPAYVERRRDDINEIFEALADARSKDVFLRIVKYIATGNVSYLPFSPYPQYQHPLVGPASGDVVFEGEVCWGDTSIPVLERIGPSGRLYGFEARPSMAAALKKKFAKSSNVCIEALGLWSHAATFHIEDRGAGSCIKPEKTPLSEECRCIDLDSYVAEKNERCDLIKLDIEGAEQECLKGALGTIRRFRPKLQISLYHRTQDYLDIPLMILRENLGYTLFMGHHSLSFTETCLYALPSKQ